MPVLQQAKHHSAQPNLGRITQVRHTAKNANQQLALGLGENEPFLILSRPERNYQIVFLLGLDVGVSAKPHRFGSLSTINWSKEKTGLNDADLG
jgi:hypothetical protein